MDIEKPNCIGCHHIHADNGNCTAVGGFCTAVPAAYCPLIPELRAENAQLRAELEYEKEHAKEHANAYYEECGQWEAENEKLRETVDKYATAARVIALHLKPFCDESLPYDEMIADAARKASDELEQVKQERDAAQRLLAEHTGVVGMEKVTTCAEKKAWLRRYQGSLRQEKELAEEVEQLEVEI